MDFINDKKIFEEQLKRHVTFMEIFCGGIVIGTKLAIHALGNLRMESNKKIKISSYFRN